MELDTAPWTCEFSGLYGTDVPNRYHLPMDNFLLLPGDTPVHSGLGAFLCPHH